MYGAVVKKFLALRAGLPLSLRKLAQATGIPKSSVARHCRALHDRAEVTEAVFWEQAAGHDWLRLLVLAVVFVFGIKAGVGVDRLSEFCHRIRIDRHVGCSPTALRRLRSELEEAIMSYGIEQQAQAQQADQRVEICAGVDETFFDQVILVMMDLVSGYIVLEEAAEDRTYATWQARAGRALGSLGLRLRYVVSDRAKALVKLALRGFGCPSIPDVFHALRDLAKAMSIGLALKIARVDEKLMQAQTRLRVLESKGKGTHVQQRLVASLREQASTLRADQASAQALLRQASLTVHPFVLADSTRQRTAQVETALHQTVDDLTILRARHTQRDNTEAVAKFTRQIPALAALIDTWWQWVEHHVAASAVDIEMQHWLCEQLLPTVYWQRQLEKTTTPALKAAYQQAFEHACQALNQHPLTGTLTAQTAATWQRWAMDQVALFQRASSPVEGGSIQSTINHFKSW